MRREIIITEIDEIPLLAKKININRVNRERIKVNLPFLTTEENLGLEKRITKYYGSCGCSQGKITGIITFIAYGVMVLTGVISIYKLGIWNTILLYFGISFVTMLIAKVITLKKARRSLFEITQQLRNQNQTNH